MFPFLKLQVPQNRTVNRPQIFIRPAPWSLHRHRYIEPDGMPQPRRPGLSSPRTPTAASSSKVHVAADDAVPQSPLPEPGSVLLCGDLEINIPPKSPQRGETLESPDSISPKKKTVHMPPNRKMPTNWKPPWDFSGPDPKPRELLNGPPPDSMLTVAKVQASVRKALQRVRFMRMRVDKARRVADGAGEQSYQQQVSAQQHAEENPTLVGFESGAAIEETRVMLTLRELGMAAMRSEMNCSDYAWGLEQLHAYLGEYEQRLRVADKTLTARSKRKPPITKQPIDSGGDEELWCIQCTCREANNLVDEARKACNTAVGRAQVRVRTDARLKIHPAESICFSSHAIASSSSLFIALVFIPVPAAEPCKVQVCDVPAAHGDISDAQVARPRPACGRTLRRAQAVAEGSCQVWGALKLRTRG